MVSFLSINAHVSLSSLHTMNNPQTKPIFLLTLAAAVLIGGAACSPSGDSGSSPAASNEALKAFPESADIAMYFDQKAMSESEFSKAVAGMQETLPQAEESQEIADTITEITGLSDDDVTVFALAVSGLEMVQVDPTALKISGAVSADKVVTADQIVQAITYVTEQSGESFDMTVTEGEGVQYIEFPKEPGAPEIFSAVTNDGSSTTAFFGDKTSVDSSVARSSGSIPAALSAPSMGLIDGQQGWISIILPESLKAQLAGMAAQGEAFAPGLSKIQSLESIGVGMMAADDLAMKIGLNLGSEEDAQAIASILNNQLISFAKMMVAGNTPEPLPVLDSLVAGSEGSRATLSLAITLKDLEILQTQLLNFLPGMGLPVPGA
ncbi:MAG: hypothetical protein AAGJ81_03775 [Verrucomicrobiota bacterium]